MARCTFCYKCNGSSTVLVGISTPSYFYSISRKLCMTQLKKDLYIQLEDNINISHLNEGSIYCLAQVQLRTSKLLLKSYIIKRKCRYPIFIIWFKAVSAFSIDIHSLILTSLFGLAPRLDTREDKLTYFDMRHHPRNIFCLSLI